VPTTGVKGAAIASLASYVVTFVVLALGFRSITGVPMVRLVAPTRDDIRTSVGSVASVWRRSSTYLRSAW
jgi:Na+-driven multidrug efflux pump